MAITINVKGYEKPFTFPDGTSQEEIEAALRTIPPAPVNPVKEALAVADTGVRGSLTALPGLFADTITGQSPTQRKLTANAIGAMLPKPVGDFLRDKMIRSWKEPLTPMAPSEALQMGMQTPQTELGKASADVTAGVTGAFMPGGQLSTGMKVAQGVGSGLGSYFGEKVGGPVGSFIGGVLGGVTPSVANRFRPDSGSLAKELLHGVDDQQIADTVQTMRWAEGQGIPVNASQAATFGSNLDAAVELLSKKKQGQSLQDQLAAQPRQLQLKGKEAIDRLPGSVLGEFELNRSAQEAATARLQTLWKAATSAWTKLARRNGAAPEKFSQEGVQELVQKLRKFADAPEHVNTPYKAMAEDAIAALEHPVQPQGLPAIEGKPGGFNLFTGQRIPETPGMPATKAPVRYVDDPVAVRDALESRIGAYEQLTQRSGSPDRKLKAKQDDIRAMFRELIDRDTPNLRAANDAYSTVIREAVNPTKEGVVGYVAGARGALPGEQSPAKILNVFDRGTPLGAKRSEILTLERNLRAENPLAFQNAAKTWIMKRFSDTLDNSATHRLPENLGSALRKTFGNPGEASAKWQTSMDIVAGMARSAKLNETDVIKGFRDFVQAANYASKRPSYMTMLDPAGVEQATGSALLRNAGKVNPFTPLKAPMFWAADKLDMKVLTDVAENLTSADGLLKLQQLARTRPDSPVREALLRSLTGATAATNAASSER